MAWLRWFALVSAVFVSIAGAPRAQAGPVDLALVLAVDVSRSIDDDEFTLQRRGYAQALTHPAVIAAIQTNQHRQIAVTYLEWAGHDAQKVIVPWTMISDAESGALVAEAILAAPRSFYGWTSISGAIDIAVRQFARTDFEPTRKVIDISGDGVNNSGRPVTAARDEAVALGITINGLVIMNERPSPGFFQQAQIKLDEYYRENVVGGSGAFVIAIEEFDSFAYAIVNKLLKEIAALPDPVSLAQHRPGPASTAIGP